MSENNLTVAFFKYWPYIDAISTINPFKQLKCALESKFSNFKIFKNCKYFVSLNDHNNRPTALTTGPMAFILSQYKVYFHPHEPFLFS